MPQAELEMRKNRSVGLDVTRIYAFLSVVAVHSFLNTEFYSSTVIGKKDVCNGDFPNRIYGVRSSFPFAHRLSCLGKKYGIKQLMHFKIL